MISVIVPAYQEEKYIEGTLHSIASQRTPHEIIVVDSGSTDKTVAIAKKYANHVIIGPRGVSKARNLGASRAKGGILLFLDADTRLAPNALDVIQRAFKRGTACVCGNVSSDGPVYARFVYRLVSNAARVSSFLGKPLFYGMCFGCTRKAFENSGGFRETFSIGEDINLSLRMGTLGRCVWLRDAMVVTSWRRLKGKWILLAPYTHVKNFFKMALFGKTDGYYPPMR